MPRARLAQLVAPLALALGSCAIAAADDDQRPRPPVGAPDRAVAFDPLYFELAAGTGGDFYFWTPGEFATTTTMPLLADEPIMVAHGELSGRRELAIPVDAGLARLDVFAGAQARAAIDLRDPSGRTASHGRAGVALQRTRLMLLASIADPTPGTWTLSLGGAGLFSASARGAPDRDGATVTLLGLEHVEHRGRPGHEGLFELREPPEAGGHTLCRLRLEGGADELVVDFLAGDGEALGLVVEPVEAGDELGEGEWLGRCPVPTRPHRVRVRGRDAAGHPVQRVEAALRDPMKAAGGDR
jgi:hypothetical protein